MRTRFDDRLKVLHGSAGSDHDPLADHPALKRAVPPTPERYDPGPVPGDPIPDANRFDERVKALRNAGGPQPKVATRPIDDSDPIRAHEYDERVRALRAAQREDES